MTGDQSLSHGTHHETFFPLLGTLAIAAVAVDALLNSAEEPPSSSMNQMCVNLDIVIGEGNPGAIALHHQAAEGSAIEDCTIDATHGGNGIQGGIGSGGSGPAWVKHSLNLAPVIRSNR